MGDFLPLWLVLSPSPKEGRSSCRRRRRSHCLGPAPPASSARAGTETWLQEGGRVSPGRAAPSPPLLSLGSLLPLRTRYSQGEGGSRALPGLPAAQCFSQQILAPGWLPHLEASHRLELLSPLWRPHTHACWLGPSYGEASELPRETCGRCDRGQLGESRLQLERGCRTRRALLPLPRRALPWGGLDLLNRRGGEAGKTLEKESHLARLGTTGLCPTPCVWGWLSSACILATGGERENCQQDSCQPPPPAKNS